LRSSIRRCKAKKNQFKKTKEKKMLRPVIACSVLGAVVGSVLAAGVLLARAEGTPNTVTIDNFFFTPGSVTVKAGTAVTWTNKDDIPHGIASANNAFKKSPALDTDESYAFTFATPGTYQYFCYLHPKMVGTIVVEQ
jgi:plastocyanin